YSMTFRRNVMKLARRQFLHLAAGTIAMPTISRGARAQTYPFMLRMLVATTYLLAFFGLTGIAAAQQRPVTAEGGSVAIVSEFPDISALSDAIEMHMRLLEFTPRTRVPLAWAHTQNNLGIALATLGGRESGTARLEAAIAAFHEALMERTRARVPLDWAATQ